MFAHRECPGNTRVERNTRTGSTPAVLTAAAVRCEKRAQQRQYTAHMAGARSRFGLAWENRGRRRARAGAGGAR